MSLGQNDNFRPRNLLLLADSSDIAKQIEQSLASYHLNHNIQWFPSLDAFYATLTDPGRARHWSRLDLCLIAYVDDPELTRQTLMDLRRLPRWQLLPVVVFVTPKKASQSQLLYQLGANSVLSYPLRFEALKELLCTMDRYWFEVVSLPPAPKDVDPDATD